MDPISWEKITTVAGIYPQRESNRKQARPAPSPSQAIFLCTPNPFQSPEPRLGLDKVVQAPLCKHALPKLSLWTMRNRTPTFWEVKGVAHLILQSRPPCSPLAVFPPPPDQLGRSSSPSLVFSFHRPLSNSLGSGQKPLTAVNKQPQSTHCQGKDTIADSSGQFTELRVVPPSNSKVAAGGPAQEGGGVFGHQ